MDSQITLSGYVGTDVEFSSGPGWVAARFRLGCTPSWRKGIEWVSGETTWMSIRSSGAMAENVRDSVHKGDPMVVSGHLRTRRWRSADGANQQQLVVEATALGHDLARGVSIFTRPVRASVPITEEEPLGPSESESMGLDDDEIDDEITDPPAE